MSQTLTYTIGKDYRSLVDDVQNFKIDFESNNSNWVQARQYEASMRQVFVNVKNEDGTPFNLTGTNIWFEGILPDKTHKILDAKHAVILDATNGEFRFDMPKQAFSVAGSYVQAFFRIVRDGASVTTLEFDLEVLADKVISNLVARDYITPFEDLYQQLTDIITKAGSDIATQLANWTTKFQDEYNKLVQLGTDVTNHLADVQSRLNDLEAKIKSDGLFTDIEAKELETRLSGLFGDISSYKEPGTSFVNQVVNEADDRGINVRHFGAKGDGQADDTDAFQKALDYASTYNRTSVFVPAGKYVITKELVLNSVEMYGQGVVSTTLIPKTVSRLITMQWKSILRNIRIDNSQIDTAISDICLAPVSGEVGTNNIITDIYIDDSGDHEVTGILAAPKTNASGQNIFVFPNVVSNITMGNVFNGIHLLSSDGGWVNGNVFENITIQGFRNAGIWLDAGTNPVSISHNSFRNIQVQYQSNTPSTARAFKINYGVNNKFEMIHTWQDQGTSVAIPSFELQPAAGVDSYGIRNNMFDGILESEIDADEVSANYNDLSQIKLSYWLTPSFKNGYGALNRYPQKAENLLPVNLISDYVNGVRSPLQNWGMWKVNDRGIDRKGYYVKFVPTSDKNNIGLFGLMLNKIMDKVNKLDRFTVVFDFDLENQSNSNVLFQTSATHYDNSGKPTVLPKKYHQMTQGNDGTYRYYETFDNSASTSSDPLAVYCMFNGCDSIKIRSIKLLPNWVGPMQDISETRITRQWTIQSDSKITINSDNVASQLGLKLIPNAATNDWFDKNLVTETQRSNGKYIYTYPIFI